MASFFPDFSKIQKNEGLLRDFSKAHAPGWVHRILDGVCRILDGVCRILDGVCRILEGVHRILDGVQRIFERVHIILGVRLGGWHGGIAGRVWWRAGSVGGQGQVAHSGWQGGEEGQVGWLAWLEGDGCPE